MPAIKRKNKKGCYYQWGNEGTPFYYDCDNKKQENEALDKARTQGVAITLTKIKK